MTPNNSDTDQQVILATGGYDHTIKLWQTHTGMCSRTMQHSESQVNALEITPDKQYLASASYQHIYMYDLASNNPTPLVNYEGISKNVTCLGFHKEGKWMYSGGEDCRARIWDLRARSNQCPKVFEVQGPINCVALHPNQVELFVGDQNGIICRWDLRTDRSEQLIPETDTMILDIDISPDGSLMSCVNIKGTAYIWGLTTGTGETPTIMMPKHKFEAHKRHALKCKFSPCSKLLVTTSADQTAKIWDTTKFSLLQELKRENQRWVWGAAFSGDSEHVFTVSSDGLAKLWNVSTGAMEREYSGHQKPITALAFKDISTNS